ncbi:hypothetical protein KC19_11G105200 [Ceratodon purpureus]|uniref:Mitochondrial carrier protein n=1 Tax=Ceratodon purpureus TaxID=3225 RepID=A0A8T0GG37_CERPU|nr:hypothetical protein KC19_11G105200 [Ceratodon purpureus]
MVEGNVVSQGLQTPAASTKGFFSWREFAWGALASGFGETLMHPVDTLKTRIQSGHSGVTLQKQSDIGHALKNIVAMDGVRALYRGVVPGLTGSMITGATYFGFIESTKDWLEHERPNLAGPWAHFCAGAMGDTIGSVVYVPCEVLKQRMQIQGSSKGWHQRHEVSSRVLTPSLQYYTGLLHAGRVVFKYEGFSGLYAGYLSTLARDVPFAGFQIMLYEGMRKATVYGRRNWAVAPAAGGPKHEFSSWEELIMGGTAGGLSAFLTTPMDVLKTRLQIQGSRIRYKGWFDAWHQIWRHEGVKGFFRGAVPRVLWFVPASAVSFMAVEWLRKEFNTQTTVHIDSQSVHPDDTLSSLSSQAQIDSIRVNPASKQKAFEP